MDAPGAIDMRDAALIQIVDAAMAEAARKSGAWLVCRPGCTECCIGAFAVSALDARRLRRGLAELAEQDPQRAMRVRERARASVARIGEDFPGDPATGLLATGDEAEARFEEFANEELCPALDPEAGTCDLYAARPITCRTFGPPVRCGSDRVGICELCFDGAEEEEIAACEVEGDPDGVEGALIEDLGNSTGTRGETIVAFALVGRDG